MKIEVENVSFNYNSTSILKDVTLKIEAGKMTCIIGPNGAGKTTFLKILASILMPTRGVVYIDGKDSRLYSPRDIAKIIAYSEPYISRSLPMTVLDFLSTARYPYHNTLQYFESSEDLKIIEEIARELDIVHLLRRKLDQISSGELQRVLIAHALAKKPKILLLDEPSAFLDIRYRFEILNYVKRYTVREGITTVVAIHDLHLASVYCDTVVLLDRGRIVACGSPHEVFMDKVVEEIYGVEIEVIKIGDNTVIVVPKPKSN